MAKYVLKVPVDQDDTAVFAIHSECPDYQLLFFLNRDLKLRLKRQKDDLEFGQGYFFPWFAFDHQKHFSRYTLIQNKLKTAVNIPAELNLFADNRFEEIYHVLPEYKRIDYLLKVEGESEEQLTFVLEKLKQLDQIVMAYALNSQLIKSKTNLIY
ncbi:MAG: IPExxxVDY family protein [Bacteroidetes bacterium]|nr:IPExxxVDY family protein [Bacteroidota bacterium]MDA0950463.1 IPExxxVDY family protein [Bacteroidota bacterium]